MGRTLQDTLSFPTYKNIFNSDSMVSHHWKEMRRQKEHVLRVRIGNQVDRTETDRNKLKP